MQRDYFSCFGKGSQIKAFIMKIMCATDSFKGSLSAVQATQALADGVRSIDPDICAEEIPLSDGGEGFAEVMAKALEAEKVPVNTRDSLGAPLTAPIYTAASMRCSQVQIPQVGESYAKNPWQKLKADTDKRLVILEAACAIGLEKLDSESSSLLDRSSYGLGVLLSAALDMQPDTILIGLGGSATNDAGMGMLAALGVRFRDGDGKEIRAVPQNFLRISSIDMAHMDSRLQHTEIRVACDVNNPLMGEHGATFVYGRQKGGSAQELDILESSITHISGLFRQGSEYSLMSGAGAAGGIGFALLLLGAKLESGADMVMDAVRFEERLRGVDVVFTGEGCIDDQTLMGKLPSRVAMLAQQKRIPTVAFGGSIKASMDSLSKAGFCAAVPIVPKVMNLDEALAHASENLSMAAARTLQLMRILR